MKVLFVQRDPGRGGKSVEEIYEGLFDDLKNTLNVERYTYRDDINKFRNIRNIYALSPDVVHITSDMYWICLLLPGLKTVLTIHDIGRYTGLVGIKKWLYRQLYFYWPTIFASAIITVSEFTRKELLGIISNKVKKKVCVIHNPVPTTFQAFPTLDPPGQNVILQVGTGVHKNLESVIRALVGLPYSLNIIGRLSDVQKKLLDNYAIQYRVFENLSYGDVYKCYLACDLVTFISHYEGFGMPVIEAQAAGRPIIISRHASLPEVAGAGAHYINQIDNAEEIQKAIEKVLMDDSYRRFLVQEGYKNIERFSREKILGQYLSLYSSLK